MRSPICAISYPAVSHYPCAADRGVNAPDMKSGASLRLARDDLKDEADLREAARTEAALRNGVPRLVAAALFLPSRPKELRARDRIPAERPGLAPEARHAAYS